MERKVGFESLNDEIFQSQLKAKYKSQIFIGNYVEKRLCESLKCYRDVIVVNSNTEKDFIKDLNELLVQLNERTSQQVSIGIAAAPYDHYTILTELDDGVPFGKFWFQVIDGWQLADSSVFIFFFFVSQIKTIKFRFNEVQIKLKKLRSIEDADAKTFAEMLRATTKVTKGEDESGSSGLDDAAEQWKALFEFWKSEAFAAVAWFLSISINRRTITETIRFISLVIVSLFAGSTQIVKYFGIFGIKLIERTTWLAHVLTPVALGLIDLVSKIIGGLYLLIAMIWKDSIGARRPPGNAIEADPRHRQREAIRYNN